MLRHPLLPRVARAVLVVALACSAPAAVAAPPPSAREVEVERVKPRRPRLATLRFLKANRDFIRGRIDLLREQPVEGATLARDIDPRFLDYARLVAEATASRDSVALADEARARRELLASVGDLARLEEELDALERALAGQRVRLATLERDFAGRQETALTVVLAGDAARAGVSRVTLAVEDREPMALALEPAQAEALRLGGALQWVHTRVEPREQVLAVTLEGGGPPVTGHLVLDPARDRLTVLHLDLGAPGGMRALTWIHEAGPPAGAVAGAPR